MKHFSYLLEFWLIAVYYEFEVLKNPFKGRSIFNKALSMNRKRGDFWIEYFIYEMKVYILLKQRESVLQQAKKDTQPQSATEQDKQQLPQIDSFNTDKYAEATDLEKSSLSKDVEKSGYFADNGVIELEESEESNDEDIVNEKTEDPIVIQDFAKGTKVFVQILDNMKEFVGSESRAFAKKLLRKIDQDIYVTSALESFVSEIKANIRINFDMDIVDSAYKDKYKTSLTVTNLASSSISSVSEQIRMLGSLANQHSQVNDSFVAESLSCLQSIIIVENLTAEDKKTLSKILDFLLKRGFLQRYPFWIEFIKNEKFNESLFSCYLSLIEGEEELLLETFNQIQRNSIKNENFKKLNLTSKNNLKNQAFEVLINNVLRNKTIEIENTGMPICNLIVLSLSDSKLLELLGRTLLSSDVWIHVSLDSKTRIFRKFLEQKNFCPLSIIIDYLKNSENFVESATFENILTFKPSEYDLWRQYLVFLKRTLKMNKAEQIFRRALQNIPESKKSELEDFYNSEILIN